MSNEQLLAHIEEARKQLETAANLGPEDDDIVGSVLTDIINHVTEGEPDADEPEHLSERLMQAVTRLESDHPRFAATLRRITRMLSDLGI